MRGSEPLPQLINGQICIAHNTLEKLGVEDLPGVVGDGDALAFCVAEDPMTSTGSHFLKA